MQNWLSRAGILLNWKFSFNCSLSSVPNRLTYNGFLVSQKHNRHKFRWSMEEFIEIKIHAAYLRKNQLRLSKTREDSGRNQICADFEVNHLWLMCCAVGSSSTPLACAASEKLFAIMAHVLTENMWGAT